MAENPHPSPPPFAPALTRPRHDGWTADRQVAFVKALAESACVEEACAVVGMDKTSAYRLRRRPSAYAFRDAWDAALDYALNRLEQTAVGRAIHGTARPLFYKGEQVGEWRHHDERLTMFLLRYRRAARFGPSLDRAPAPRFELNRHEPTDEAAVELADRVAMLVDMAGNDDGEDAGTSNTGDADA